jgi:hypothetical protein
MKPEPLSNTDVIYAVFLIAFVGGALLGLACALAFGPCGG